jgi:phage recombination protein Bet
MSDTELAVTSFSDESRRMLDGLMVVKDTLAPDLTVGELQLFAMVASRSGLDPFARQIYAVKRQGRMVIQTGIDGYRSIAARTGEYDGQDEPVFGPDCGCVHAPKPHPEFATVRVYRKGMSRAVAATAYWHEYVPDAGPSGKADVMWRKMPHVMIAKVAEALALRKAFPWDPNRGTGIGSDVYTDDEMAQADRPVSTVQERIAARVIESPAVGVSLRYFAEAVRDMDPEFIRNARAEMFPDASGVAALDDAQRMVLLDRLLTGPGEPVYTQEAPAAIVAALPPSDPSLIGTEYGAAAAITAEMLAQEPGACGATSPFTDGATCILPNGHRGFHRSGPNEAWPR